MFIILQLEFYRSCLGFRDSRDKGGVACLLQANNGFVPLFTWNRCSSECWLPTVNTRKKVKNAHETHQATRIKTVLGRHSPVPIHMSEIFAVFHHLYRISPCYLAREHSSRSERLSDATSTQLFGSQEGFAQIHFYRSRSCITLLFASAKGILINNTNTKKNSWLQSPYVTH